MDSQISKLQKITKRMKSPKKQRVRTNLRTWYLNVKDPSVFKQVEVKAKVKLKNSCLAIMNRM